MTINPTRKLDLSPEALAALKLPLTAWLNEIEHGDNNQTTFIRVETKDGTFQDDCEIAAFIAALVNAAFTPAPAVTVVPETNAELGQLITTEFEAAERWTAADILEREG